MRMSTFAQSPTLRKTLLSLAALGAASSMATMGTYAAWTDTAAADQVIDTSKIDINLAAVGTANRLTVGASDLVPGDTIQRRVDLVNAADTVGSITLTVAGVALNALTTDANGLRVKIEKCNLAWVETVVGAGYTYTCGVAEAGTRTTVLADRLAAMTDQALASLTATTGGNTDSLLVTTTLPAAAPNTLQDLATTLTYTFTANQRAAGSR